MADDLLHHIARPVLALQVNPANVLTQDANADQLRAAQKQDRHHQR
jgi:hypothetical protein